MKKVAALVIVLAVIWALGCNCSAADKSGYVVRTLFDIPDGNTSPGSVGESYCRGETDYVTGCSYLLNSYPGGGSPADYIFNVVQPIGCEVDRDGFRVCTGCWVELYSKSVLAPQVSYSVYAYCGRSNH